MSQFVVADAIGVTFKMRAEQVRFIQNPPAGIKLCCSDELAPRDVGKSSSALATKSENDAADGRDETPHRQHNKPASASSAAPLMKFDVEISAPPQSPLGSLTSELAIFAAAKRKVCIIGGGVTGFFIAAGMCFCFVNMSLFDLVSAQRWRSAVASCDSGPRFTSTNATRPSVRRFLLLVALFSVVSSRTLISYRFDRTAIQTHADRAIR